MRCDMLSVNGDDSSMSEYIALATPHSSRGGEFYDDITTAKK